MLSFTQSLTLSLLICTQLAAQPVTLDVPMGLTVPPRLQLDRAFQSGLKCGPNALYFLLRISGIQVDYDEVAKSLPVGERGVTLAQIQDVSARFGLSLVLRKMVAPDDLAPKILPVIVHLRAQPASSDSPADHFVVLFNRVGDVFGGFDTANMMLSDYSMSTLARNMTGYVALPHGRYRIGQSLNRWLFLLVGVATAANLAFHVSSLVRVHGARARRVEA